MRLLAGETAAVVIDIQERLFPHMHEGAALLERCCVLVRGLELLEVPILVTEQYPRGLGPTVDRVRECIDGFAPVEKISFSCCDHAPFLDALRVLDRRNVVLAGIEAHVCVLQTAIDLLDAGLRPVLVEDCISSRRPRDRDVAVERMRHEGAVVTTAESLLFELCRAAGTDRFKSLTRLVK